MGNETPFPKRLDFVKTLFTTCLNDRINRPNFIIPTLGRFCLTLQICSWISTVLILFYTTGIFLTTYRKCFASKFARVHAMQICFCLRPSATFDVIFTLSRWRQAVTHLKIFSKWSMTSRILYLLVSVPWEHKAQSDVCIGDKHLYINSGKRKFVWPLTAASVVSLSSLVVHYIHNKTVFVFDGSKIRLV